HVAASRFSHHTPPTALYTLSLHDALPICRIAIVAGSTASLTHVTIGATASAGDSTRTPRNAASPSRKRTACACTRSYSVVTSCSDRKSTRLNSSHVAISYAVFCLKKKNTH